MIATRRQALAIMAGPVVAAATREPARAASEVFRDIPKAMWVWKTSLDELDELRAFATRWGIRRILLALNPASLDRLGRGDTAALKRLRADGLAVSALAGDPSWGERPDLPRTIARIIDLTGRSDVLAALDLDVEPHALKAWRQGDDTQRARLMEGLLQHVDMIRARAPKLALGAAVNPIYARLTLAGGSNVLETLAKRLDSVQLMAYRPSAQATVAWASPAVAVLERAGTPWWSGVLVHAGDENNTSYFGQPASHVIADMVSLHRAYSDPARYRAYRGLVFEDYAGLRELLRNHEE